MNRKTFLTRALAGATAISLSPIPAVARHDTPADSIATLLDGIDASSWLKVRELFPLTHDRTYLNTGGLGPPSQPVLDAIREQSLLQATRGETYHNRFHEVRETTARFMGAQPEEIAFTRNATEGNSIIAAGLRLNPGDEVIFESHAHPGGSFPWLVQQKEHGLKVRIFEPDNRKPENNLQRIFELVNDRTRVIQVSHITAPTGILFDAPAIAREAHRLGLWFHIDGAQSAGMIPIDLHALGCDSYATSGHKWLNGPQESGILYIRKDRIDDVACSHAGAYSDHGYELPDQFAYNPTAQRHEYGTRDAACVVGLETALKLQERIGKDRIANHGKRLADLCRKGLREINGVEILTPSNPAMYNSILTFKIKGKSGKQLAHDLVTEQHLRCREVSERGLDSVRVSWHVYHTEADVEKLVAGVRALA